MVRRPYISSTYKLRTTKSILHYSSESNANTVIFLPECQTGGNEKEQKKNVMRQNGKYQHKSIKFHFRGNSKPKFIANWFFDVYKYRFFIEQCAWLAINLNVSCVFLVSLRHAYKRGTYVVERYRSKIKYQ